MSSGDFVQADRAEGARLVELPTEGFGFGFDALVAAHRLARCRPGVVVFRQDVGDDGVQHERPAVLAVYGQVPDGWLAADRVAA